MIELQSSELDCTTNLRQIFDRLPDHLQAKWRKSARRYHEENSGKEPTLKELSKFIITESQTENDPVYGRSSRAATKFNKPVFTPRVTPGPKIPTLATEIQEDEGDARLRKTSPTKENQDSKNGSSIVEVCKVCKGPHTIPKCSVFLSKGVAWRRRFARFNTLCYRCLSPSHLQRGCPEKKGCTEKNCARPLSHHLLLHLSTTNDVDDDERNTKPSTPPATDLTVHNATMEDSKRSFVLLKVVPLRVISENGVAVTTYGLLDTAAVSFMISSHLAERLKLQVVPEKVSINTVTHKNHDCELSKVRFQIGPTSQDGPCFTVYHALAVEGLNVSDQYCPNQLDLSEWPHLEGL